MLNPDTISWAIDVNQTLARIYQRQTNGRDLSAIDVNMDTSY